MKISALDMKTLEDPILTKSKNGGGSTPMWRGITGASPQEHQIYSSYHTPSWNVSGSETGSFETGSRESASKETASREAGSSSETGGEIAC